MARRSDAAPQPLGQFGGGLAASMPPVVRAATAVVPFVTTRHRDTTFLAELSMLRFHACRNFRHVRNKLGTEPHRVRRAGLLDLGTGSLSGDFANAAKQGGNWQRQPKNEGWGSHIFLPGLDGIFAAPEGSDTPSRRRWPGRKGAAFNAEQEVSRSA